MEYYRSEKEAAYFALRRLESFLPPAPESKGIEWGMAILRCEDANGGYWYTFQEPTKGTAAEWQPTGVVPKGWKEYAYCHTHPNDAPFSSTDIDTALGKKSPYPRCTMYMVTQSGAYWYDGKFEDQMFARNAQVRYGKFWGKPYNDLFKK